MPESPTLIDARRRLAAAETSLETAAGLAQLAVGLELLDDVIATGVATDGHTARTLASTYASRIYKRIGAVLAADSQLPEPELEPGAARLEVELSEVCGTDVHLAAGRLHGVPYPLIPGHVTVGRLSAIRGVLRDVHGRRLAEGDRVTFLDVHRTCNACWYCLVAKATTRCPERKVYGITYGMADGLCGGWAEVVRAPFSPLGAEVEIGPAGG